MKSIGEILKDLGIGNDFMNRILIVQEIIARTDKLDFIKLEDF